MSKSVERNMIQPRDLIKPERFDICAKHIYARLREHSPSVKWGRTVYEEHIKVLNGAREHDEKVGMSVFIEVYDAILDSVKNHGFDSSKGAIPVNDHNDIIDGSHRTTACLFYDVPLIPTSHSNHGGHKFTWKSFQKKGLAEDVLDAMVLEYCHLRDGCLLAIVYPSAAAQIELIESVLSERCEIVLRKKIHIFGKYAPLNIIRQVYANESWLGRAEDGYKGATMKAQACFAESDFLYVLLLQVESLEDAVVVKERAREKIGISNHSLHITDDYTETIAIARMFFNANSTYFFNYATPMLVSSHFDERLLEYAQAVGTREDFAVHGGSVMEVFGIRQAGDFDYISGSGEALKMSTPNISLENEKVAYSDFSIDDLLFDPRHHFYFCGVKFVNLSILERQKVLRGLKRDLQDVALIKAWRKASYKWKLFRMKQRVVRTVTYYRWRTYRYHDWRIYGLSNRLFGENKFFCLIDKTLQRLVNKLYKG